MSVEVHLLAFWLTVLTLYVIRLTLYVIRKGQMSEKDFRAEAVKIVAGMIEKRRPDAAAWETAYYTLIRATLRECERRLRGDDLIRQMLEAWRALAAKRNRTMIGPPDMDFRSYGVGANRAFNETANLADEQIKAAEKYLEVK